mmetsp:Transcript_92339/g.247007  ORF Transcript_92339/g.247007 Transcript_92339/m.247007 type:complete len:208 (+) Transcript_92339:1481-2104(+)
MPRRRHQRRPRSNSSHRRVPHGHGHGARDLPAPLVGLPGDAAALPQAELGGGSAQLDLRAQHPEGAGCAGRDGEALAGVQMVARHGLVLRRHPHLQPQPPALRRHPPPLARRRLAQAHPVPPQRPHRPRRLQHPRRGVRHRRRGVPLLLLHQHQRRRQRSRLDHRLGQRRPRGLPPGLRDHHRPRGNRRAADGEDRGAAGALGGDAV